MHTEDRSRLVFLLTFAVVIIFYLALIRDYPILALTFAGHDDALFFRGLENIKRGNWLGRYDNLTLAKGPLLSMVGALSTSIGIKAKFFEAVLYAASIATFAYFVRRLGLSRALVLVLVILLISNPYIWSDSGRRFLREGLYVSSAMMVLCLTVMMVRARENKTVIRYSIGVGLFLGCMYLNREEDIWIISGVVLVIILSVLRKALRDGVNLNFSLPRSFAVCLLFTGVGVGLSVGPVLFANKIKYDRAIVSEFRAPEFKAAIGALMRVGDKHPSGYVPVPQAAMQTVFETFPVTKSIQPYWSALSANWSVAGQNLIPGYSGEVAGGWFVWAFRDAVAMAGHYETAAQARAFYTELAAEINAGCDEGIIECRPRRDTLRPELLPERFPDFLTGWWSALVYTTSLATNPIAAPRSTESSAGLHRWSESIGPIVAEFEGFRVTGWIAHRSLTPTVQSIVELSQCGGQLTLGSGIDVEASYGSSGIKAVRFDFFTKSMESDCDKLLLSAGISRIIVPIGEFGEGPFEVNEPFFGYLDGVQRPYDQAFLPSSNENLRLAIIKFLVAFCASITPVLIAVATIGLILNALYFRNSIRNDWLVILSLGAAALVIGRCAIIGYIDVTSWRAINTGYLGPAYPFVIIYAVLGTAVFIDILKGAMSRYRIF
ncbi:hypothetical protein SAMN05216227_10692 [Pseudorhodobacter antarcticus]|uniref:Dolichyl-phosphate-mannose-protein mannosyltransferase n=1 Tax=Pseudorhodobacter antarcticus TaxID=1077947 RepID=A0A1H8N2U7_9RHOB|nr:hypothetical protein [Pseudorhodobacter antarcticus]SEO23836.1 hypothetical protein SAMN05216227_10692 [Pseudorhodobacter antarcticus]